MPVVSERIKFCSRQMHRFSLAVCSTSFLRARAAMPIRWASISTGLKGEADTIVETNRNTARHHKSGSLDVFATPAMIALMEEAACTALKNSLSEGETTVRDTDGTRMICFRFI
jgi:hypothetical protein